MYALVDCNNFYVSCERVFQPKYNGKPVIVLSNNDGCAIARSEEAKAIGIEMGAALHQIRDVVDQHQIKVFSSNYTLYGDMSRRVYKIYDAYSPHIEMYSIDECFLFLADMPFHSLNRIAVSLKATVKRNTGIPVSVGIAPTKTLAKLANRYAKKKFRDEGVYSLDSPQKIEDVLKWCPIGDVWGIGRQYAAKLNAIGVYTAYDFIQLPEEWIRVNMSVVGLRMHRELCGDPCIKFEEVPPAKKGICTSHQFGKLQTDKEEIKKAVANFAAKCAFKLRKQKSCAANIRVFMHTNEHRTEDKQFNRYVEIPLINATSSTNLIIHYAMNGVDMLYKRGYNFHKAGVMITDIVPEGQVQLGMWQQENKEKNGKVMKALDGLNATMGKDTVRFATQGYSQQWKLRNEYVSKCYTTRLEHIVQVND